MSVLWSPSEQFINNSNLYKFQKYIENKYQLSFHNYQEIWEWSVQNLEAFWEAVALFFDLKFHQTYSSVLKNTDKMYETKWFDGATISYTEHVFRNKNNENPAIIYKQENQASIAVSWQELEQKVSAVQQFLKSKNIQKGDRIVGYLPNNVEAIIAFFACNSLGAIWSCCSPDFGTESIVDRFQQIEPKLFIAASTYNYNGKSFNKIATIEEIASKIPSLENVILIGEQHNNFINWASILEQDSKDLEFTPVEFQHPIWILYSSGTTGKPKGIVHSTGGNLIEHYKALALHQDCKKGERYLWYSTTGWMMWNYALSSLLVGCTLCIFDGAPNYPDFYSIWEFIDTEKINHFGIGAAFYLSCKKEHLAVNKKYNLTHLRSLGSTGSPLPADGFEYIYQHIKKDVWLISLSGGTDICSAFVGGSPYLSVYAGEIQCRMLGASVEAWNESGKAVEQELGELMLTKPMPSMPVYFWNDANNEKYKSAYFEDNDNIWRHGDWIKITKHQGVIIYGRSDATLNRDGVRIGTAEVYNAVEILEEIKDSLVICIERENGSFYMPLFVVLQDGIVLNDELKTKIKNSLRKQYSPRHVPDEIIEVNEIPYTISGKKMEMPIKKIMMGMPIEKSISLDAMKNPNSIDEYLALQTKINEK
ncbi:MAG TPA: acetoacetate--CoA ligase [Chitinophagales bacterium]|nr:acetoacetate--CoA ligase [Chitinophagales bacterium]HMV01877.1 acetoacetate--CoA ligase [Chitinophagales bacterium]HMW93689.1 acetoacetate--CoA ligase [Chitinophagales bacterium]HMY43572.1 acetoacetate--CoA ligase [Chitinophagales bacterium]HMZ67763.1 acetoacetate--CoA ligase [Chitinophagales bacterium]